MFTLNIGHYSVLNAALSGQKNRFPDELEREIGVNGFFQTLRQQIVAGPHPINTLLTASYGQKILFNIHYPLIWFRQGKNGALASA